MQHFHTISGTTRRLRKYINTFQPTQIFGSICQCQMVSLKLLYFFILSGHNRSKCMILIFKGPNFNYIATNKMDLVKLAEIFCFILWLGGKFRFFFIFFTLAYNAMSYKSARDQLSIIGLMYTQNTQLALQRQRKWSRKFAPLCARLLQCMIGGQLSFLIQQKFLPRR